MVFDYARSTGLSVILDSSRLLRCWRARSANAQPTRELFGDSEVYESSRFPQRRIMIIEWGNAC
jgi:hypothetical protein